MKTIKMMLFGAAVVPLTILFLIIADANPIPIYCNRTDARPPAVLV
jgi:hypothetical protein